MSANSTIRFDDNLSLKVLPGMLECSKQLIHQFEYKEGQQYSGAYLICAATFCALTAELSIKYKLQQEGTEIPKTHDLYRLYQLLNSETRDAIQQLFGEAVPAAELPIGWNNVDSIFMKARHAYDGWRYLIQTQEEKSPIIGLRSLHNAATSVFMAINSEVRHY